MTRFRRIQGRKAAIAIICGMHYGPPWNEGVANLSRQLARRFIDGGAEVAVLFPYSGDTNDQLEASAGETLVPIRTSSGRSTRPMFWVQVARVLVKYRNARGVLLLASARPTLSLRVALLQIVTAGRLAVYIPGLASTRVKLSRSLNARAVYVGSPFLQRYFPEAACIPPVAAMQVAFSRSELPEPPTSQFRLLYLGAAERARGLEYLLEGLVHASYLAETPVVLRLALNGHGDYSGESVREMIECLGLSGSVLVDGNVELEEAYRWAHAVVIPRASEMRMAFPLRLVEALVMSRPLIVTDACEMDQLLHGAGLGVPRCDALAIGQAIARLADDDALYRACVAACEPALEKIRNLGSFDTLQAAMNDE